MYSHFTVGFFKLFYRGYLAPPPAGLLPPDEVWKTYITAWGSTGGWSVLVASAQQAWLPCTAVRPPVEQRPESVSHEILASAHRG